MISIIIGTYNRAASLKQTLQAIDRLDYRGPLEVLVVDNNSTDETKKTVDDMCKIMRWPVRYFFEKQQGVSFARNRGLAETKGTHVIFTDDDVLPEPQWLTEIMKGFESYGADCVSGRIKPFWIKSPEPWMLREDVKEALAGIFGMLDHGNEVKIADQLDRNFFFGANMAFKKSIFAELGGFRTDLGVVGKKRLLGEDTDILERVFNAGKKMVYMPEASVNHTVLPEKMDLGYVRRWRYGKGLSVARNFVRAKRVPPKWLLKECVSNGAKALVAYMKKNRDRALELELQFWSQLGLISGIIFGKGRSLGY